MLKYILPFLPFLALSQSQLDYTIEYSENLNQNGLKITLSIDNPSNDTVTSFYYSNSLWGQDNLFNCISFDSAENKNCGFQIQEDSNRITVHHPANKKTTVTYRITQDFDENNFRINFRPRVQNNYFSSLGFLLFIIPESVLMKEENNPNVSVTLNWKDFPEEFKLHNTFGSQQKKQHIEGELWGEFLHSSFVGGDYRIYKKEYKKKPVFLAIRGKWLKKYTDTHILNEFADAIKSQRDFWQDSTINYYTLILSPSISVNDSSLRFQIIEGTALHNGFVVQSTNNPFNDWASMNHLLNHEMMHYWINGRISVTNKLNYWFSEGFTDYYSYKNRLSSGKLTKTSWAKELNDYVIQKHWNNPKRNIQNYEIKDGFWKNRNIEKVPYRRGAIFALWLDNKIQIVSNNKHSLDDLMRELLFICDSTNASFSDQLFLDLAKKYAKEDLSYFFQKHIISGVDIPLIDNKWTNGISFLKKKGIPILIVPNNIIKE